MKIQFPKISPLQVVERVSATKGFDGFTEDGFFFQMNGVMMSPSSSWWPEANPETDDEDAPNYAFYPSCGMDEKVTSETAWIAIDFDGNVVTEI